jgi:hypothetical protein
MLGDISEEGEQQRILVAELVEERTTRHGGVVVTTPELRGWWPTPTIEGATKGCVEMGVQARPTPTPTLVDQTPSPQGKRTTNMPKSSVYIYFNEGDMKGCVEMGVQARPRKDDRWVVVLIFSLIWVMTPANDV